jgi:putative SOS response-associated peptidase YedK
MCGRFEINANKKDLVETFDIDDSLLPVFEPTSNIPPSTYVPVIYNTGDNRQLSSAFWGLVPSWSKDKSFASNTFNARSETVSEKPSFKSAYKSQRCLIPATGYYEWAKIRVNGKVAGKQPFWIGREDETMFAFAGLYERWADKSSGEILQSCTVITREAYPTINHIHPRMPVILPSDYYQAWLDAELDSFPMIEEDDLKFHPVDKGLGSTNNNYELNF